MRTQKEFDESLIALAQAADELTVLMSEFADGIIEIFRQVVPPVDSLGIFAADEADAVKSLGFTLVRGSNTWVPKPLYEARARQRRKLARQPKNGVIWTR